jgi:transcriptional regulator with XRE-family HTH domain
LSQEDRIRELRKKTGLTQVEFAGKIGVEGATVSRIESGNIRLTSQNILLICTPSRLVPGKTVSDIWLRTGEGEIFRAEAGEDRMETELLGVYRRLQDENKAAVNKHAKYLLWEQEESAETEFSWRGDITKKAEYTPEGSGGV